jgi:hypothetical protein
MKWYKRSSRQCLKYYDNFESFVVTKALGPQNGNKPTVLFLGPKIVPTRDLYSVVTTGKE